MCILTSQQMLSRLFSKRNPDIAVSISKSSIAQGIPVAVPQAVPIVAIVGIGVSIGDGFSHGRGVSLSFSLVVIISPARPAVVAPVIALIALIARCAVAPCVGARRRPVVRALY